MSIKVAGITKVFGAQKAVNDISFEVKRGEILGFLGPNGAGKSTTMKMITCYLTQTEGNIEVCGFDTLQAPMEVRKRVGYLPEHNPLYKDMYVKEYLSFVAGLHKIKNHKSRVDELIEMTGLTREQHKPIQALSKGYRQRVGLAQAMIHDPEVLILDEPTSGLDPNQLVEIRKLIKRIGAEKTVIFSTHIMQEVQAICDRVVIINQGKLVADDPIQQLRHYLQPNQVVRVEFKEPIDQKTLSNIKGLDRAEAIADNQWRLVSGQEEDLRPVIFNFAVEHKKTLLELHQEDFSVEEVFQQLTN